MHFHYVFSAAEILWTLTFAAELVLLVVLLGRDRARRFPWFTVYIVTVALLLLTTKLLFGRLAPLLSTTVFLAISDLAAVVAALVVLEVARRAFAGSSRRGFLAGAAVLLGVAAALIAMWGPWPAWKTLIDGTTLAHLRVMQMFADKGAVLTAILDVELALVVVLFGRRFQGGWRTHAQQIAIGLSTAGLSQLAVRVIWQLIATHTTVHSQAQYERLMALRDRMYQGNNVVFLCALVWWIVWIWLEEPAAGAGDSTQAAPEPQAALTGEPGASA
ncbi:MAG: twin-arginine translocation signal domain-containing protein [Acidobacteriota bacterium]